MMQIVSLIDGASMIVSRSDDYGLDNSRAHKWVTMNEIKKAAFEFHRLYPYACGQEASREAQAEFPDPAEWREFFDHWRKFHDAAARSREEQYDADVDRIWSPRKYD